MNNIFQLYWKLTFSFKRLKSGDTLISGNLKIKEVEEPEWMYMKNIISKHFANWKYLYSIHQYDIQKYKSGMVYVLNDYPNEIISLLENLNYEKYNTKKHNHYVVNLEKTGYDINDLNNSLRKLLKTDRMSERPIEKEDLF